MQRSLLAGSRLLMAALILVAVVSQLIYGSAYSGLSPVNFYSYFTIESNIIAAVILLAGASAAWRRASADPLLDKLRGAATLYMLITGLVYSLLLTNVDVNVPLPWVNAVLHYIAPVALLLDWLLQPPRRRIGIRTAVWWLLFPLAYLMYSLVRGHFTGWYPYPFLDAATSGYATVLTGAVIIGAGMAGLAWLVTWLGNRRRLPVKS